MLEQQYQGLFIIGDPHLEARIPGLRKDDYPHTILNKLIWCFSYAQNERLLPIILGDLFDKPRDNSNWLMVRLLEVLPSELIGIYGNHDCAEPQLNDHDSLSLLVKAGRYRLVDEQNPWRGEIGGRPVIIGGSSYRQPLPERYLTSTHTATGGLPPFVVWLTHHDFLLPDYDEGRIPLREVPGIDMIVNGHIHRKMEAARLGGTLWCNPGNISRRARSEATRTHVPAALRVDLDARSYQFHWVELPHEPFDAVFHEVIADPVVEQSQSAFITGLAELQARRTASGAGLLEYLRQNAHNFAEPVIAEIYALAHEVTTRGQAKPDG
jgi:DNA repair exonuclease SbcCD nuclease subunit